jgi:hypothetical protein
MQHSGDLDNTAKALAIAKAIERYKHLPGGVSVNTFLRDRGYTGLAFKVLRGQISGMATALYKDKYNKNPKRGYEIVRSPDEDYWASRGLKSPDRYRVAFMYSGDDVGFLARALWFYEPKLPQRLTRIAKQALGGCKTLNDSEITWAANRYQLPEEAIRGITGALKH